MILFIVLLTITVISSVYCAIIITRQDHGGVVGAVEWISVMVLLGLLFLKYGVQFQCFTVHFSIQ